MAPEPPHLCAPLAAAASTHPSRPFTRCGGRVRCAGQTASIVSHLAAVFESAPGWARGARVAVVWGCGSPLPSCPPFAGDDAFAAILAATAAGGVAAPVNGRLPPSALGTCLAGVEAAVVVVCSGAAGAAAADAALAAAPRLPAADEPSYLGLPRGPKDGPTLKLVIGDARDAAPLPRGWSAVSPAAAAGRDALRPRSNPPSLAALVFTSGSSGPPKAAALTHAALHWAGAAKTDACGYREDDAYLHAAPLCHVGGLAAAASVLSARACHVFLDPRTGGSWPKDAAGVVAAMAGVTALAAVPASLVDLASSPGAPFRRVRTVLVGGGALSPAGLAAARAALPAAAMHGAYGLTEAGSSVTYARLLDGGRPGLQRRPPPGAEGAVWAGRPPPGAVLVVAVHEPRARTLAHPAVLGAAGRGGAPPRLPDGWAPAPVGVVGPILTSTPSAAVAYFRDGRASAETFLTGSDGTPWLRTGDLGAVDARGGGGLWLVGRGRDVLRVGGETVHAASVDAVLGSIAGLSEGLAVGVPDDRLGSVVGALVVLREGVGWAGPGPACGGGNTATTLTPAAVAAACRAAGLPGFALPRVVVGVRGRLPTVPGTAKPCRRAATAVVVEAGRGARAKL